MHSSNIYSATTMGDQATSTLTLFPTQSHYHDIEPTSPCHTLKMPSARLGSDKYRYLSHWFDSTRAGIPRSPKVKSVPSHRQQAVTGLALRSALTPTHTHESGGSSLISSSICFDLLTLLAREGGWVPSLRYSHSPKHKPIIW